MSHNTEFVIENGILTRCVSDTEEIILPDEVTKITVLAFEQCVNATQITLPRRDIEIEEMAFAKSRARVVFADGGMYRKVEGDFAFIGNSLDYYLGNAEHVVIPDGVTRIGGFAFAGNEILKSVTIPAGVTHIGEYTFSQSNITQITIPDSVLWIGSFAFYYCRELEKVVLPPHVLSIRFDQFWGVRV